MKFLTVYYCFHLVWDTVSRFPIVFFVISPWQAHCTATESTNAMQCARLDQPMMMIQGGRWAEPSRRTRSHGSCFAGHWITTSSWDQVIKRLSNPSRHCTTTTPCWWALHATCTYRGHACMHATQLQVYPHLITSSPVVQIIIIIIVTGHPGRRTSMARTLCLHGLVGRYRMFRKKNWLAGVIRTQIKERGIGPDVWSWSSLMPAHLI